MAVMMIISYDVSDAERFADYNPGSLPSIVATIQAHGGEVLFAGAPDYIVGEGQAASVGIKFPDAEAGKAWLADPDYADALAIRLASTTNIITYTVPLT